MTNAIDKVQTSIQKLHGDERSRKAKHESFVSWQLRERAKARGEEPSPILKSE
jgi:hypothetical protein